MKIEVWADVLCPWSYLGKRRLESALARYEGAEPVEVAWRSWEMDPGQRTKPGPTTVEQQLEYGRERAAIEARFAHIVELGCAEGLTLNLLTARPVNSFDAHRLLVHAAGHGLRARLLERLLHAYHTENRDIADRAVLTELASDAGLDRATAAKVLASGAHAEDVRDEERRGVELGVPGVPTFVLDGTPAPAGALSADVLLDLLQRPR